MRIFVIAAFLFAGLSAGVVKVALAANLSYVMPEIKKAFAQVHPDIRIESIVGGSGKLATQIERGAPYDLFLSANMKYPQKLYEDGKALDKPKVYAQGAIVYLSTKERDFSKGTKLLIDPSISKIAIANPRTAPYGKAAFEALAKANILDRVRSKFVFGESIAQTVAYATKAADIGLVAKSALFAPQMSRFKKGINWSDVDPKLYAPIDQGMVMIMSSKNKIDAKAFYDFILGAKAGKIFERYGYRLP